MTLLERSAIQMALSKARTVRQGVSKGDKTVFLLPDEINPDFKKGWERCHARMEELLNFVCIAKAKKLREFIR